MTSLKPDLDDWSQECVSINLFPLRPIQIKEQCKELIFSDEHMERLMKNFLTEIEKGLKKETHPSADIKCFVTYVQELPNGRGGCKAVII